MFRSILARQFGHPRGAFGQVMNFVLNNVNELSNALAAQRLAAQPDEHILDVGFGSGLMFDQLLPKLPHGFLAGIEISRPMLQKVRRRFRRAIKDGRLDVKQADVVALPYEDGRFDKASAIHTLYFWPEPKIALQEIYRVLRTPGILVMGIRPKEFLERVEFTEHGFRAYSKAEVQTLLEAVGFVGLRFEEHSDKDMGVIIVTAYKE